MQAAVQFVGGGGTGGRLRANGPSRLQTDGLHVGARGSAYSYCRVGGRTHVALLKCAIQTALGVNSTRAHQVLYVRLSQISYRDY